MKSNFHKTSSFHPNNLRIEHNAIDYKYHSDLQDENEKKLLDFISDKDKFNIKPYFNRKEVVDFLSSKLKAMEKMNLDDESCVEGEIETRKINIDKSIFPKSKHSKNKKDSVSPRKKINKKKNSEKNSENINNNKNIIVDANGKIEKLNMKDINLTEAIRSDIGKEIKDKELNQFFSDKTLLDSILSEMN